MQHAFKFHLIETSYLFLSISLAKVTINVQKTMQHTSKFQKFKFYSN